MIEARDTRRDQGLLRTAPDMQVWLHASATMQYYRGSVSHEEGVDEREGIPSGGGGICLPWRQVSRQQQIRLKILIAVLHCCRSLT
jgi:hypothetical protein